MTIQAEYSITARRAAIVAAQPSDVGSTERVRKLNARLLSTPYRLCLHRARAYTKVLS